MTPGQVLFRSRFSVDEARDEFRRDATAARAAQADQKGWKALFKDDAK